MASVISRTEQTHSWNGDLLVEALQDRELRNKFFVELDEWFDKEGAEVIELTNGTDVYEVWERLNGAAQTIGLKHLNKDQQFPKEPKEPKDKMGLRREVFERKKQCATKLIGSSLESELPLWLASFRLNKLLPLYDLLPLTAVSRSIGYGTQWSLLDKLIRASQKTKDKKII